MDNIEVYDPSDELVHWGIKGMRWGQRRYQNKDGSLTEAGKRRLKAETAKVREEERINKNRKATQAKIDKLEARKKAAAEEKKALDDVDAAKSGKTKKRKGGSDGDADSEKKMVKKSIKDMTDEELLAAVNRSRLEAAYLQLNPEPTPKPKFGSELVNNVIKPAATNAGKDFVQKALTKAGENILKDKVDPNSLEGLTKVKNLLQTQTDIQALKNQLKRSKESDRGDLSGKEQKTLWDLDRDKERYAAEKAAAKKVDQEEAKAARKAARDKTGLIIGRTMEPDSNSRRQTASEYFTKKMQDEVDLTPAKTKTSTPQTYTSPTKADWDKFMDDYSWGVDRYVTDLSTGRTVKLGRDTVTRILE